MPQTTKSRLTETVRSDSLKVDSEAGVIRGVKILGAKSKNGRVYTRQAMTEAAALYEGRKVYYGHNPKDDPRKERAFDEWAGELRGVTLNESGVFGDFHYLKSQPRNLTLAEAADRFPQSFGLSHNAGGDTRRDGNTTVVESITDVESVDITTRPASNDGLFESIQEETATMSTTFKKLLETFDPKHKGRTTLMEMGEVAGMDAPVDVPADADADGQIDAAFKSAMVSVLDGEGEIKEKLRKLRELLKAQERLAGEPSGNEKPAEEPMTESEKKDLAELKGSTTTLLESVNNLTKRQLARDLCEECDVAPKATLLESLVKLPGEKEMRVALENEPKRTRGAKPLMESRFQQNQGTGKEAFSDLAKGGFASAVRR